MVELGSKTPFGQSFDNTVFILPAIVIVALAVFCGFKLLNSIKEKDQKAADRKAKKEQKKTIKTK